MEAFIKMLEAAGYERADSDNVPTSLGQLEYLQSIAGGKHMISLGQGRSGDDNCYTVFYFTLSGEFIEHASNSDY